MKKHHLVAACLVAGMQAVAGPVAQLRLPLDCKPQLSANFAELRPNHFHSGLDFKTEGRTGLPIHAVADGYISSIEVSPTGYGRAVFVTHPSLGLVTLYGHLEAFSPAVDKVVRAEQYRRETFPITMEFAPGQFPVKKGDVIGSSGNAGSSMGPHLHFNVHDLATGNPIDPMQFYKDRISDTSRPYYKTLYLFPDEGYGIADGQQSRPATRQAGGEEKVFTAWGRVYPAIKCNDEMTGSSNIFGVKYLALYVDGRLIWGRDLTGFDYATTRAINTLVDYDLLMDGGGWAEWTRVPASRPLSSLIGATLANGAVIVNQERDYVCRYVMCDAKGNLTEVPFIIRGKRHDGDYDVPRGTLFRWNGYNRFAIAGATATFPCGTAYDNFRFSMSVDSASTAGGNGLLTPIYNVGVRDVAMSSPFTLEINVVPGNVDVSKLCLVRLTGSGRHYEGGKFSNSKMTGHLWRMGRYGVATDSEAPVVEIQSTDNGVLTARITDGLSGIATYRATIDGRFALMEYDAKNDLLTFKMDASRFKRGAHTLKIDVADNCGNSSTASRSFNW